jgi:hypothetical protein
MEQTIENRLIIVKSAIMRYRKRHHKIYYPVDDMKLFMFGTVGLLEYIETGNTDRIGYSIVRGIIRKEISLSEADDYLPER